MIGPFLVHVGCVALVGADIVARAVRIRLLVCRLGGRLSLGDALRLNALGDAAAELTPFRIAGEPSRVGALLQSGVQADSALLAVGAEFVLSYAVVALLVVAASWSALPAWWSSIGPALYDAARRLPLWAVALVALVAGLSVPFLSRLGAGKLPRPAGIRSSLKALAGIGTREVAATVGLTGVNILARVGILWMLASTLPGAPAAGTVLIGSFVLLFGQAFAPTPSGLGVVEIGMLAGAAGPLGGQAVPILFYWRAYTAVLPILLALVFALPRFGYGPLTAILRLRRQQATAAMAVAETPDPPVLAAEN